MLDHFKPNMTNIEISFKTILTVAALILLYFFLSKIEYVLILIILAYIINTGLEPIVGWMEKKGINRGISILSIYILFILFIAAFIFFILVPLIHETIELLKQFPILLNSVTSKTPWLQAFLKQYNIQLYDSISKLSKNATQSLLQNGNGFATIYRTVIETGKFIASTLSVIVMSIYMLIDKKQNELFITNQVPERFRKKFTRIVNSVDYKLGYWLRAQGILSFIVFLLNYIALSALHIKFALTISLIAGFFEVVPVAGPIASAITAVAISLLVNPGHVIYVLISSTIIQQLENHLLVPKIMQQVIGISPLVTIIALLIGAELFGIVGAVLSVPIATIIQIIYLEWQNND